jgi:Ser-tRNA(Ala) deacylase AlaX
MTDEKKTPTIEFAPGCFDNFEGTQEELDELMAEIMKMVEDGTMIENSHELSEEDFDDLPDHVKEQIFNTFIDEDDNISNTSKRTLQ